MLALALQLLFPALALAGTTTGAVPVCTAAGIVWQVVDGAGAAGGPSEGGIDAHCPSCAPPAAALLPPVAEALPAFVVAADTLRVPSDAIAPCTPERLAHGSRAPPAAA